MDYQVVWTKSAQEDLKQLVSFIAADDPDAAERFGLGLVDHVEQASRKRRSETLPPYHQRVTG